MDYQPRKGSVAVQKRIQIGMPNDCMPDVTSPTALITGRI